ncbi:MAG: hypothetical protein ACR2NO_02870 [Chloroflexota bacterium]
MLQRILKRKVSAGSDNKVYAHLRREMRWVEDEIEHATPAPSSRLLTWARELDPERTLSSWEARALKKNLEGVKPGTRGFLLRQLAELSAAVCDWAALGDASVAAPRSAVPDSLGRVEELMGTLRNEARSWREGWGGDGAASIARIVIERLEDAVAIAGRLEQLA